MKSPFMTFNYGAGLETISRNKAVEASQELFKFIESGVNGDAKGLNSAREMIENLGFIKDAKLIKVKGYENKLNEAQNKALDAIDAIEQANSKEEALLIKIDTEMLSAIESNIQKAVKDPMERVFNENYAPLIKAVRTMNRTTSAMFRVFKIKLDKKLAKEQAKNEGFPLADVKIDEIIMSMADTIPGIKHALADDETNKLVLMKLEKDNRPTSYTDENGNEIEMIQTGKGRVNIKDGFNMTGQTEMMKLVEAYTSGSVVPIQSIDGSVQAEVLGKYDVIGVHDANMFSIDDVLPGTTLANQAMIDIGKGYSITKEMVDSLTHIMNSVSTEELNELNEVMLEEDGDVVDPGLKGIYESIVRLQKRSENQRVELYNNRELGIEHYAFEGSMVETGIKEYSRIEPGVANGKSVDEFLGIDNTKEAEKETNLETETVVNNKRSSKIDYARFGELESKFDSDIIEELNECL